MSLRRRSRRFVFVLLFMPMLGLAAGSDCEDGVFQLPDPLVITIAFGDSSTKGPSTKDYVVSLRELLMEPSEAWANEGNGGEVSGEGLDRLNNLFSRQRYPNATTLLYWEGGNDLTDFLQETDPLLVWTPTSDSYPFTDQLNALLDDVQSNVDAAISAAKAQGLTVYVATYFFLPDGSFNCGPLLLDLLLPPQAANARVYVEMLNERIRTAVTNGDAILVDVATLDATLRADDANYENCNHLSASGNAIVAQLFFDVMSANGG